MIDRANESELKLRLALRAADIGIWDWDIATGIMNYSARARSICGFRPDEELTIKKVRAVTHPEDLAWTSPKAERALDPAVRDRSPYEYRIVRADTGEVRWVLAHGEAIFVRADGVPKAVRYLGTLQDVTARKEAEHALQTSENRLTLAIEAARMAVWEYDIIADEVSPSAELNRLFGLPEQAKPTMEEFRALYSEEERSKIRQAGVDALARGSTHFEAEFQCTWPDGSKHWLLLRADVISDREGNYIKVIGVLMDIDERKRSDDRLSMLLREVNHRVKNSLSVVQALATQTFKDTAPQALTAFRTRLHSLAKANDLILREDFAAFSLPSLIDEILSPYAEADRISISGPEVMVAARLGTPLSLVLHELATNAAKYGALAGPEGTVALRWEVEAGILRLSWRERGGPPVPAEVQKGFGTRLISEILQPELGKVVLSFRPEGVDYQLTTPI